jgi:hypothetical protein
LKSKRSGVRQIRLPQARIGEQLAARTLQRAAAILDYIGIIADLERRVDVLFDQNDAHARGRYAEDDLEDLGYQSWRETKGWFVEEQQIGLGHEGTSDGEHLLLTAAEAARRALAALAQNRKEVVDLSGHLGEGSRPPRHIARDQVLFDRETLEYAAALWAMADAARHDFVRPQTGDVLRLIADVTRANIAQARNGVEEGCFARSVRPDKSNNFAAQNLGANAV